MDVTRENVDELNAILKVKVAPADYEAKVKTTLEQYRKQSNIPGFRKGKVPFGMIKKQYGQSVLAEELNKVVNEKLYKFITDEKLDILGNPIPKADSEVIGDFNNPAEFEFPFEIGLAPEFKVNLSAKNKYDYVKVKVDEKLIDQQVDDLRRRYGKLTAADKVGEKDLILGQFVEVVKKGEVKEGGVMHSSTVSMDFVTDAPTAKKLVGSKVGDVVLLDPNKVAKGPADAAALLGVKEEELEGLSKKFEFTINEIKQMELAELNQELFDKLFGEGEVKTEKELRSRISDDLSKMFGQDSDKILARTITQDLIKKTKFDLPTEFLKRWISVSQKEPIPMEEIELQFDGYANNLKWQLIQGKLFKENGIQIDQAEGLEYTKGLLVSQYAQYGMPAPEDAELTTAAQNVLQNKEEAQRIFDMLAESKMTEFFKNTVKLADKEVEYDEYVKIAQDPNA